MRRSKLATERNPRSFHDSRPRLPANMVAFPSAEDQDATAERGLDEGPLRETQQRIHPRILLRRPPTLPSTFARSGDERDVPYGLQVEAPSDRKPGDRLAPAGRDQKTILGGLRLSIVKRSGTLHGTRQGKIPDHRRRGRWQTARRTTDRLLDIPATQTDPGPSLPLMDPETVVC